MGAIRILYESANPGTILIDNGSGVTHPYGQSLLSPVWDDVAQATFGIKHSHLDSAHLIPPQPFAAFYCYVDGILQTTATYTQLVNYIKTYFFVPASVSGGGGGGSATAANQVSGNTSLSDIDTNIGAKADAAATTDGGTFSLIALIKRLLGKFPGLGAQTTANSIAVNIASDQSLVVSGSTALLQVTPAISVATYTIGKLLGGRITLAGAMRINNGTGTLASLTLTDNSNTKPAVDILLFSAQTNAGNTDNAVFTLAITDIPNYIGKVSIATTDWETFASGATGGYTAIISKNAIGMAIKNTDSTTNIYAVMVLQTQITTTAVDNFKIGIGTYRD